MRLHYWIAILAAIVLGFAALAGSARSIDRFALGSERNPTAPPVAVDGDDESDDDEFDDGPTYCSDTADLLLKGCRAEVRDDFFVAKAKCIQVVDAVERDECAFEANLERGETRMLCREQHEARLDLCGLVGEQRYDPEFTPEAYVEDYTNLTDPNPYYPLVIGHRWSFEAADESNVIEVLNKTKAIEGVTCVVVSDIVTGEDGAGEDTNDWYAQRLDGSVSYCGEDVRDFETFEGDNPEEPELVAIDGSFKHGRERDLAGTIMPAAPSVGQAYRQEMSLGNAEDAAIILSTSYGYGTDTELDEFVDQDLAELLCAADDCVVTGEISPVEPDVFDRKYYAYGIGLFFEVKPEAGEVNRLVECNFDPLCDLLPQP